MTRFLATFCTFAFLACSSTTGALESRFAREESCTSHVRTDEAPPRYVVEGCGRKVVYVCKSPTPSECVRDGLPRTQASTAGDPREFPERPEKMAPYDRRP